jgi:hypothetical protein
MHRRSAPVLGRSNVGKCGSRSEIGRGGLFGACCARGRAHSVNLASAVTNPLRIALRSAKATVEGKAWGIEKEAGRMEKAESAGLRNLHGRHRHRGNAGSSLERVRSCKVVASMLQACLKLPSPLSRPGSWPVTNSTLLLNSVGSRRARAKDIESVRLAVVTQIRRFPNTQYSRV